MPGAAHVGAQSGTGRKRRSGSGEEQWKERAPGAADSKLPLRERGKEKESSSRRGAARVLPPTAWGGPVCLPAPWGGGGVCTRGRAPHPVPIGAPPCAPIGVSPRACEQRPLRGDGAPSPDKIPTASKGGSGGCAAHPPQHTALRWRTPPQPLPSSPCVQQHRTNPSPPQSPKSCCEERGKEDEKRAFDCFLHFARWRWWGEEQRETSISNAAVVQTAGLGRGTGGRRRDPKPRTARGYFWALCSGGAAGLGSPQV